MYGTLSLEKESLYCYVWKLLEHNIKLLIYLHILYREVSFAYLHVWPTKTYYMLQTCDSRLVIFTAWLEWALQISSVLHCAGYLSGNELHCRITVTIWSLVYYISVLCNWLKTKIYPIFIVLSRPTFPVLILLARSWWYFYRRKQRHMVAAHQASQLESCR